MHILYNFATRSRPEKFKRAVENIIHLAKEHDYIILAKVDFDDENIAGLIQWSKEKNYHIDHAGPLQFAAGDSVSKVHAINRDIDKCVSKWDILVNMSDDMALLIEGFDTRIIELFHGNLDTFLHLPDQHTGDAICTMSIIGRQYYDRDGYVYHPDYKSLWCDNEATEVAKNRGCYRWHNERLYEHRHPAWGFGQGDDLLRKSESYFYIDQETYNKRKSLGFPKESIF
jgi:hypothetical protein